MKRMEKFDVHKIHGQWVSDYITRHSFIPNQKMLTSRKLTPEQPYLWRILFACTAANQSKKIQKGWDWQTEWCMHTKDWESETPTLTEQWRLSWLKDLYSTHLMLGLSRSVCLLASLRRCVMISAGSLMRGRTGLPGGRVLSLSPSSALGGACSCGGGWGMVTPLSDCHTHLHSK